MCIAIYEPKGVTLKKKVLKSCWDNNPDGAGFMYAKDGKVMVQKELDSFERFYDLLQTHRVANQTDFVIHFRIATSGLVNLKNVHPHRVNQSTWLAHNGVIPDKSFKGNLSDSIHFASLLESLPKDFILNDATLELIRGYIGNDKMIFLNSDGEIRIVNEQKGVKKFGAWFSNSTYKKCKTTYANGWSYGNSYSYYGAKSYDADINQWSNETATEICSGCKLETPADEFDRFGGFCEECLAIIELTEREVANGRS